MQNPLVHRLVLYRMNAQPLLCLDKAIASTTATAGDRYSHPPYALYRTIANQIRDLRFAAALRYRFPQQPPLTRFSITNQIRDLRFAAALRYRQSNPKSLNS